MGGFILKPLNKLTCPPVLGGSSKWCKLQSDEHHRIIILRCRQHNPRQRTVCQKIYRCRWIIGVLDCIPTSTDGEHVLWIDYDNGFHVRCDLRFINHSDEPNAVYYDTLEVWALTDIAPGEEITHDYTDSQ